MAKIINVDNKLNPADIFGKDAERLLNACDRVFHNWLYEYEGCYRSPSRPKLSDIDTSNEDSIVAAYKAATAKWASANPEEVAKEQLSRKEWECERDKQFRIIYGIARRYGLYLRWHGKNTVACCGDQWEIYRQNECIGRICCL